MRVRTGRWLNFLIHAAVSAARRFISAFSFAVRAFISGVRSGLRGILANYRQDGCPPRPRQFQRCRAVLCRKGFHPKKSPASKMRRRRHDNPSRQQTQPRRQAPVPSPPANPHRSGQTSQAVPQGPSVLPDVLPFRPSRPQFPTTACRSATATGLEPCRLVALGPPRP